MMLGGSVEGGREELVEFRGSRLCNSWTCCRRDWTSASNSDASARSAKMCARASGGRLSHK